MVEDGLLDETLVVEVEDVPAPNVNRSPGGEDAGPRSAVGAGHLCVDVDDVVAVVDRECLSLEVGGGSTCYRHETAGERAPGGGLEPPSIRIQSLARAIRACAVWRV